MSKSNLKFKNFVEDGTQSSFHVQAKAEIQNKIFGDSRGVSYLSMSRLYPKFKIFSEGGRSVIFPYLAKIWNLIFYVRVWGSFIFPYPGQIWNSKFVVRVVGSVIFPCPGKIWNLTVSVRVGGWASYHVKAKSEIYIFQWRLGEWSSLHVQAKSKI